MTDGAWIQLVGKGDGRRRIGLVALITSRSRSITRNLKKKIFSSLFNRKQNVQIKKKQKQSSRKTQVKTANKTKRLVAKCNKIVRLGVCVCVFRVRCVCDYNN